MIDGLTCGWRGQGRTCVLVIRQAALAADLITGLIFKHLEQNLSATTVKKPISANSAAPVTCCSHSKKNMDIMRGQNLAPDLLESIMKQTRLVKEE